MVLNSHIPHRFTDFRMTFTVKIWRSLPECLRPFFTNLDITDFIFDFYGPL